MKFDKSDEHLLFAAAPGKAPAPVPTPTRGAPTAETPGTSGDPSPSTDFGQAKPTAPLHQVLKAVVPTLYRKVGEGALSKRERRERIFQLLNWFCQKRGYGFEENVKQPYVYRHARVEGRLQAVASRGGEKVALEVCYELDGAALAKLRNAYLHGKHPVLIWLGTFTPVGELLARVGQLADVPAGGWLEVAVLTEPQVPK